MGKFVYKQDYKLTLVSSHTPPPPPVYICVCVCVCIMCINTTCVYSILYLYILCYTYVSQVGRLLIRAGLCHILGLHNDHVQLTRSEKGKPLLINELEGGIDTRVGFNISHQVMLVIGSRSFSFHYINPVGIP